MGYVPESVIKKIKNNEFVEFNLRVNKEDIGLFNDYIRYHYSPEKNMTYEILEFKEDKEK